MLFCRYCINDIIINPGAEFNSINTEKTVNNSVSGDIDVLLTHPDYVKHEDKADGENEDHQSHGHYLHDVVQELSSANLITDTISFGDTKVLSLNV